MNTETDDFMKSAILDYNIAPWNEIFPELTYRAADDSLEIITIKLYEQLNTIFEDRNYLKLVCGKLEKSKKLMGYLSSDTQTFKKLDTLYGDIMKSSIGESSISEAKSNLVRFNEKNYDMHSVSDIVGLSKRVKTISEKTEMMTSSWYQVISKLKEIGLIQPCGSLLVSQGDANFQDWELMYRAKGAFGGYNRVPYPYSSSKSFGEQIGICSDTHSYLSSVLPIVSQKSIIKNNIISNIYFLDEEARSINYPKEKFIDTDKVHSQSIKISDSNRGKYEGERVYDVENSESCYIEYQAKKPTLSFFNINKEQISSENHRDLKFSLVPLSKRIMETFDLSKKRPMSMNVYYSSGNDLPKRLYNQIFN